VLKRKAKSVNFCIDGGAWEGGVKDGDHGGGEEAPGKELQEYDDQGVVEARLTHTCARHHSLHLLGLEQRQDYTCKGQLQEDRC
jgi:hypothetical protein